MRKLTLSLSVLFFAAALHAQTLTVTTLAGSTAGGGYSDGDATHGRLSWPRQMSFDQAGNLYVADRGNHSIRKIAPNGTITTFAGANGIPGSADGTLSAARFNLPSGVAVDPLNDDLIYVADTGNQTIRKITGGRVTTIAGSVGKSGNVDGSGAAARFYAPGGLVVDTTGLVYIADTSNHRIRKMTASGVVSTLAGGGTFGDGFGTQATFSAPTGIALDLASGNLIVSDRNGSSIRRVTTDGRVTTIAGVSGQAGSANGVGSAARFTNPHGVTVDPSGNVFVADSGNTMIRKIAPDGTTTTFAGSTTAGARNGSGSTARFQYPTGIVSDRAGTLFVADSDNNAIRKITPAAEVTTFAGQMPVNAYLEATGTAARFYFPAGATADAAGNVYVFDFNNVIRRIAPDGSTSTVAGNASAAHGTTDGKGSNARFYGPVSGVFDSSGNLFIADLYNHTIRKMTPDGTVTTFAGSAGNSGSADGTGSAARFNLPWGVAIDSKNIVYVADTYNHRIRTIDPNGVVTTFAGVGNPGYKDAVGTSAAFRYPTGVAVDAQRNIYVADWGNNVIRKITQGGVVTTLAGENLVGLAGYADGFGNAARFDGPNSVAVDAQNYAYVADESNHAIRRITPAGDVTTVAGAGQGPGNVAGDGLDARFLYPAGIAIAPDGRLLIADTNNGAIKVATYPAPEILSFAASPSTIKPGDAAQISWTTRNATDVSLTAFGANIGASGTFLVRPPTTTTYTLTATGPGGTATATVTVTVSVLGVPDIRRRSVVH